MANTAGLTDEEMLDSVNATVRDWDNTSGSTGSRRSHGLAERLDAPMSQGGPSARVIRKSPTIKVNARAKKIDAQDPSKKESKAAPATAPPPVLGSIVERKRTRRTTPRTSRAHPTTGFPTLQKPVGTYTPKNATLKGKTSAPTSKPAVAASSSMASTPAASQDILQETRTREADQMLAGMSVDEIRSSVEELEAMLPPDTLAFLRDRKKKAQSEPQPLPSKQASLPDTAKKSALGGLEKERLEKERVSKLLSAVQTFDDMDALYQAEAGEASTLANDSPSDSFAVACDLLRSTVPRQTLWAVRTVRDRLQNDLAEGRTMRLPMHPDWPYPSILPVSLRCLLDQPPTRVNAYALHTHALEALYLLLRLRCAVDHDVDVTDTVAHDPASVYQLYFQQDAVPTPPLHSVYSASQSVKPLSVGSHDNVAYSTASSSTTAQQDGQRFAQDPLWTLLSQMRILPRLATLFQSRPSLPHEALVAASGILALIAQRSAGAATAMVQHKTLLHDLSRQAWEPDASTTAISLAVVRLWIILARQSRTAAAGLELPPWGLLLGQRAHTREDWHRQRWTLVLWRTLMRYGLALTELECVLTLAASQLAVPKHEYSLTADYFSCWAVLLQAHYSRAVTAPDETTRLHELRLLVQVRVWLSSSYRQALSLLESSIVPPMATDAVMTLSACLRFCCQYRRSTDVVIPNPPGEYKTEETSVEDDKSFMASLQRIVNRSVFSWALTRISPHMFRSLVDQAPIEEAAAASFLAAFTNVLNALLKRVDDKANDECRQEFSFLRESLSKKLVATLSTEAAKAHTRSGNQDGVVAIGWRNCGRLCIWQLLQSSSGGESVNGRVRMAMTILSLAWLQTGDEAIFEYLLQLDVVILPSELKGMVYSQINGAPQKSDQMHHSLALHQETIATTETSMVVSEIQSLRSEADIRGAKRHDIGSGIPLGEYWLWKVLTGSAAPETPVYQTVQVLSAALSLIDELEEADTSGLCRYAASLDPASKMYFLMNLCLQSEEVLAHELIQEQCERLYRKYEKNVDPIYVKSFAESCASHSAMQHSDPTTTTGDSEGTNEEENKFAAALLENDIAVGPAVISGKTLRLMMDFMNDLCIAFVDYGAQYPFFAAFLRVFLYPSFPAQVRCEILQRLQGLLHLVSLSDDTDTTLAGFLGDDPSKEDVLDALASRYTKSGPERSHGLVELITVAELGRALGQATQRGSADAHRRRVSSLQPYVRRRVVAAARFCLGRKDSNRFDLAHFVHTMNSASVSLIEEDPSWETITTKLAPLV